MSGMESEIKYVLPAYQLEPALGIIKSRCMEDYAHGDATIYSIYYDSQVFNALYEKVNSDFYKSKARLRWYKNNKTNTLSEFAYAEAKFKLGSQRVKQRAISKLKPIELSEINLQDNKLNQAIQELVEDGVIFDNNLFPTILIQYKRLRFIEPMSSSRISIDSDIQVSKWNERMLPAASCSKLQSAVIEIKGNVTRLPESLEMLSNFGLRKSSFSKYLSCVSRCEQLTFDPK